MFVNFAPYKMTTFPFFQNIKKNQKKSESDWNKVRESKNYTQKLKINQLFNSMGEL